MKRNIITFFTLLCCLIAISSCRYDNYDEPQSMLTGRAVYNGEAVSVRSGGAEFALFQDGYALHNAIPVYIAQDGTYSATLFDGEYKLVRMGNAPWERPSNDTILITVHGNTVQDIPVTPYFFIENASFAKNGSKVTAKFTVKKVVANATLEDVRLYLGETLLTDNNINAANLSLGTSINFDQEITAEIEVPESLANEAYLYARVGVKSGQSSEYCYTQSTKVELN